MYKHKQFRKNTNRKQKEKYIREKKKTKTPQGKLRFVKKFLVLCFIAGTKNNKLFIYYVYLEKAERMDKYEKRNGRLFIVVILDISIYLMKKFYELFFFFFCGFGLR